MSEAPEIVISDTSCLIILTKINRLDLLHRTYHGIMIPPEVASEYRNALPEWILIRPATPESLRRFSSMELDEGERAAFALAADFGRALLIIDDLEARRIADRLGIRHTGTLGVLLKAKERHVVDVLRPILADIQQTDFRMSLSLVELVLNQAGEQTDINRGAN